MCAPRAASPKVLGELAAFDVKQLTKKLPALRELSEQPVKQVLPNPSALRNVSETLAKVSDATDDYWPTVLRFIQFASAGMSNNAPPSDLHPIYIGNNNGISASFTKAVIKMDGGSIDNATFTDSRIIFTNTPTKLVNVKFINCAFEFPENLENPSPLLQKTARQLLVAGIQSASFDGE